MFATNFVYADPFGTRHSFSGSVLLALVVNGCGEGNPGSLTTTATDGSGLILNFGAGGGSEQITTRAGKTTQLVGTGTQQDTNGNFVTYRQGTLTDTLGQTALTVSGASPNPVTLSYTNPRGTAATYTVTYKSYTIKTNFGCSQISDYGPVSNSLVDTITLPDGSVYQFNYEDTPGFAGDKTGRLSSIQLPTGGTIAYTYTGGNGGIICADGSAAGLTRATPDGTWTYSRAIGAGAASTTTITDPQGNQTVVQFQGIYETQRQAYQGTVVSGTLLQTVNTCYNGAASPCTGTAVVLPIARRTQIIALPGGLQSKFDTFFNSYGLQTEIDEYGYGSGAPGGLIRKVLTTYASLGNGIVDKPASITLKDSGGNIKSQATYAYDETAVTPTSGTPQHNSVSGSRGNATTIKSLVGGTTYLTKTFTYWDTGKVNVATDVNGAQTIPSYSPTIASCGNSFPTSISYPLSLSGSYTWNCVGAVLTQVTDANGQNTTTAYANDPSFWRPDSVTDPANAVMTYSYPSHNVAESSLLFNANNSTVDVRTTLDSLGRPQLQQKLQAPNATNYDSVEQDYDSNGRPSRKTLPYSGTAGQTNPTVPAKTTTYDALGRPTQVADAGGGTISYTYSQNDVLVSSGPAPAGENMKRRQMEYDALGRLTSVCELTTATGSGTCGQTTSQTGYWTKYTYDVLGNLTGVTQNAQAASSSWQTRSYSYDALGRLTSETNPESGTVNYTYDADATCGTSSGDLVKRVDAQGNTACVAYDAAHRPKSRTYSGPYAANTPNKYYVYDAATVNGASMPFGKTRLVEAYTAASQNGTKITDVGLGYSPRGEASDIYESTSHSGGYYHLNQTYWEDGAPKVLSGNIATLPSFTYGVDGEGRPNATSASSGQNPVTSALYNVFGQVYQVNFGSLDSDIFSYDQNTGRVNGYQFNVNNQSAIGAMNWNPNGTLQKLAIVDPFNSADNQTCKYGDPVANPPVAGYDDLNRLISANCGSVWTQNFTYDPFGNLSKSGTISFLPVYQDGSGKTTNRYVSIPGVAVSYDANGSVLGDGAHNYTWDADAKPVTIDGVGLAYDAQDRMVEQNRSGAYSQIVYSPSGAKIALMGGQTLQKAFVSLPGGAQAVYTASGLSAYRHTDWLGNNRMDSTPTRTVSSTTAYGPFGEPYAQSGTADPSFTGENQDTVPGLYDFLAREYNDIQGRWPSPDPGGLATAHPGDPRSWNRYAYVRNNPLSLVDPTGLDCSSDENGDCGDGPDMGWVGWFYSAEYDGPYTQAAIDDYQLRQFYGDDIYRLPGYSDPIAQALGEYLKAIHDPCVYTNDDGSYSVDRNSSPNECRRTGGIWVPPGWNFTVNQNGSVNMFTPQHEAQCNQIYQNYVNATNSQKWKNVGMVAVGALGGCLGGGWGCVGGAAAADANLYLTNWNMDTINIQYASQLQNASCGNVPGFY